MEPALSSRPPTTSPAACGDDGSARELFRRQFFKTEPCRFYRRGCMKGRNCSYAHGEEERRTAPDLSKTSLCRAWIAGSCTMDNALCPFAHGRAELRRTPTFDKYGARQSTVLQSKGKSCSSGSCANATSSAAQGSKHTFGFEISTAVDLSRQGPKAPQVLHEVPPLPAESGPTAPPTAAGAGGDHRWSGGGVDAGSGAEVPALTLEALQPAFMWPLWMIPAQSQQLSALPGKLHVPSAGEVLEREAVARMLLQAMPESSRRRT